MLNQCLALYLGVDEITAVMVVSVNGKIEIKQAATLPMVTDESDEVALLERLQMVLVKLKEHFVLNDVSQLPVVLSLGGNLYQAITYHSDFKEMKLIEQTLRFDIEEELFVDGSEVAIAYERMKTIGTGSDLMVYAAKRKELKSYHDVFANEALDTLVTQPCEASWGAYLRRELSDKDGASISVGRSEASLCIIILDDSSQPLLVRNTLCLPEQDAMGLMQRELKRCIASLSIELNLTALYYHADGFETQAIETFAESLSIAAIALNEVSIKNAFAIGAAISWVDGSSQADFRQDDLTPVTIVKERKLATVGLSVSVGMLLVTILILVTFFSYAYKALDKDADKRMVNAWKQVTGEKRTKATASQIPKKMKTKLSDVKNENIRVVNKSLSDSMSTCLFELLNILNALPEQFDMNIEKMQIKGDSVDMAVKIGDDATLKILLTSIKTSKKLELSKHSFQQNNATPHSYTFTLKKKKVKSQGSSRRGRSRG